MARTPDSVMNITCRLAERGVGGGPTRSRPPVIDLANNRLRSNFILPRGYPAIVANFPPARGYFCVMVTGAALDRPWTGIAASLGGGARGRGRGLDKTGLERRGAWGGGCWGG